MSDKTTALIRRAVADDLPRIDAIQSASPEAARWDPRSYLSHECLVVVQDGIVVGFLSWRELGDCEAEILNLSVDPEYRRRGLASRLIQEVLSLPPRTIHLEVRSSNESARALYRGFGFSETGIRQRYYDHPQEDGIVMTRRS